MVKFALGRNYTDEAWCDVVPMTVCHLLLGRPWLYDKKVLYNGYANSYSFKFNGKKFVLNPLQISEFNTQPKQNKKEVVPMLTIRQFTRALKGEQLVLFVVN